MSESVAQVTFEIPGPPMPYKRVQRRAGGRAYKLARAVDHAHRAALYARAELTTRRLRWPTDRAYRLVVEAHMPTRRRIDVDNIGKAIMDALTGILWDDDSQIVELVVHKHVAPDAPRTRVVVQRLEVASAP